MKRFHFLAIAFLALVVAALGVTAASGRAVASEDDGVTLIRQFMRRPDLALTALPAHEGSPDRRTYATSDRRSIFTVDVPHGLVVVAILPPGERSIGVSIGQDQALQIASAFAALRVAGFDRLALVEDKALDHGVDMREYQFVWADLLGSQQAMGLQRVSVSIDAASGAVRSFSQTVPSPTTVNVEPDISGEQAVAAATQQFGMAVKTASATLEVGWRDNDRTQQVLRWTVFVDGERGHALYFINAHTGQTLGVVR